VVRIRIPVGVRGQKTGGAIFLFSSYSIRIDTIFSRSNRKVMVLSKYTRLLFSGVIVLFSACGETENPLLGVNSDGLDSGSIVTNEKQFTAVPSSHSGIDFKNTIVLEQPYMNCFNFYNIYNGGGVAVGDINNDGLADVYFTGNQIPNQLYLNKGGLKFEDITNQAVVGGSEDWTTGVTMVDLNGDGWLDIYVCMSGGWIHSGAQRANRLYVNNGDLTFSEQAQSYGIADTSYSTHASFFDYDLDGDLDLYLLNHPVDFGVGIGYRLEQANNPHDADTDNFYRNNGDGTFTDVTDEAGVRNYGFGLSVITSDFNNDGWPDVFVANDYSEADHLYINQGDGTFKDDVLQAMSHISQFSMGSDAADFNNDGWTDLMVVDMMAEDNRRKKTNMSGMFPEAFYQNVKSGRHYQYMQNVLQLNNSDGTFSDVAELAGLSSTDWSWSTLFCDLDNDGLKDIYITNGQRRDIRNQDFQRIVSQYDINYIFEHHAELSAQMPVEKVNNYAYRNNGDLTFEKKTSDWGLSFQGFSNGATYADLDNDGDLDLVVNNLEDMASIFENKKNEGNYLRIALKGEGLNSFGIGAKAVITIGDEQQIAEVTSTRGFLSCSEPILHFGLGSETKVGTVQVTWPDGRVSSLANVDANQVLTVNQSEAVAPSSSDAGGDVMFEEIRMSQGGAFTHKETAFDDFEKERLLPHRYSQLGPFVAVADVNGDGFEDFYVGGANGQAGAFYRQTGEGIFRVESSQAFSSDREYEDMDAEFLDVDNDGDLDLFVASGSNEHAPNSPQYANRVYTNAGGTSFQKKSVEAIPQLNFSSSCVKAADIDNDGDQDLFVGGRVAAQKYPYAGHSVILINENGTYTDQTQQMAPGLSSIGMVTDASWTDIDGDSDLDLVVVGEWMAPTIFTNNGAGFVNSTVAAGLADYTGWWYSLEAADMDNDGDMDFVAGNLGLNSKYQASASGPFTVYGGDLDGNGSNDIVLAYDNKGVSFPVRGRECSSQQIPELTQKFATFEAFGVASIDQVYSESLANAFKLESKCFSSSYIENLGGGKFKVHALPAHAQRSAVNGIVVLDIDGDGNKDIVTAGNMYETEVETSRHDASIGTVLKGDGKGGFKALPATATGFVASGDVKDLALIKGKNAVYFAVTRNNGKMLMYRLSIKPS
jgi:hypothetical protein